MPKKLVEIASEIVQTQVSLTPMSAVEIASSLRQVFITLNELQKAETTENNLELDQPEAGTGMEPVPEQKPVLTPQGSIQNDKVICLECGAEMKQLTSKHLVSHGMGQKEYKKKYGFTMRTPLAAKSLTKARSKAAKKRGLPEKLSLLIEARRKAKTESAAKTPAETGAAAKPKRTILRKKKTV